MWVQHCLYDMAVVAPFYHDIFNAQKHIDEVGPVDLEPAVKELAALIIEAEADRLITLTRTHKHIDLDVGEVFVASWGNEHPVEVKVMRQTEDMMPVAWFLANGIWTLALFMIASDNPTVASRKNDYKKEHPLFAEKLAAWLTERGMSDIGFCMPYFPDMSAFLVESTDTAKRVQYFHECDESNKGSKAYITHWTIDKGVIKHRSCCKDNGNDHWAISCGN